MIKWINLKKTLNENNAAEYDGLFEDPAPIPDENDNDEKTSKDEKTVIKERGNEENPPRDENGKSSLIRNFAPTHFFFLWFRTTKWNGDE